METGMNEGIALDWLQRKKPRAPIGFSACCNAQHRAMKQAAESGPDLPPNWFRYCTCACHRQAAREA